jgi:serine/threonine protein kinase
MASLGIGDRLGAYESLAAVGAGGMGEVYRARDTRLKREVAIKCLPEAWAEDHARRQRFTQEARAIAALTHPHICTLYDVAFERGQLFLVMELLEGETLARRLIRRSDGLPLERQQALSIATELAEALACAHKKGIVHRDLKPANIFLTKTGVKLLDFGLAKLRESGDPDADHATRTIVTGEQQVLGTLPYMSPEQLEGRADKRSDIFAFGAVLFEMLKRLSRSEGIRMR